VEIWNNGNNDNDMDANDDDDDDDGPSPLHYSVSLSDDSPMHVSSHCLIVLSLLYSKV